MAFMLGNGPVKFLLAFEPVHTQVTHMEIFLLTLPFSKSTLHIKLIVQYVYCLAFRAIFLYSMFSANFILGNGQEKFLLKPVYNKVKHREILPLDLPFSENT